MESSRRWGPVDNAAGEGTGQAGGSTSDAEKADEKADTSPRRLYRIPDGAMIAGVCNGLAAYVKVDVRSSESRSSWLRSSLRAPASSPTWS